MPCQADDAAVASRDPALPGLTALLDDEQFAARLRSAFPTLVLTAARVLYLRYKPATSCIAAYEATIDGERRLGAALAVSPDAAVKLDNIERRGAEARLGELVGRAHDQFIAFTLLPFDDELPAAEAMLSASRQPATLKRLFADHPEQSGDGVAVLRYKPGRRLVVRVESATRAVACIKAYSPQAFDGVYARARWVSRVGRLPIVPVVGRSRRDHLLAFPWIDGTAVRDANEPRAHRSAGHTIAELHARGAARAPALTPANVDSPVAAAARAVATLDPSVGVSATRLAARVSRALESARERMVVVHGDCSPDQFISTANDARLIDFDHLGLGPAALDLGSYCAWLVSHAETRAQPWRDAFLTGYQENGGRIDESLTAVTTAAALLRLTSEPFRLRHLGWHDEMHRRLSRAEELISRVHVGT
jgi:aminoglycoside phosphotransferase (APT) family kinase protein